MKNKDKYKNKGFSLLLSAVMFLGFIVLIGGIYISNVDDTRAKSISIYIKMKDYAAASKRIKADTECYPLVVGSLFNRAVTQNSFCDEDISMKWKGPYVENQQLDYRDNAILSEFNHDSKVSFDIVKSSFDEDNPNQYVVTIDNIPGQYANGIMDICNKGYQDEKKTKFKQGYCSIVNGDHVSSLDAVSERKTTTVAYVIDNNITLSSMPNNSGRGKWHSNNDNSQSMKDGNLEIAGSTIGIVDEDSDKKGMVKYSDNSYRTFNQGKIESFDKNGNKIYEKNFVGRSVEQTEANGVKIKRITDKYDDGSSVTPVFKNGNLVSMDYVNSRSQNELSQDFTGDVGSRGGNMVVENYGGRDVEYYYNGNSNLVYKK